jgi:hypothetical protein
MTSVKGRVTHVREHADTIWFYISSRVGHAWISISRTLFEHTYKKKLISRLYSKHNREVERKIKKLEREIKILKKEKRAEHTIKDREYQIHSLRGHIKKELHLKDLEGKRIVFKLY